MHQQHYWDFLKSSFTTEFSNWKYSLLCDWFAFFDKAGYVPTFGSQESNIKFKDGNYSKQIFDYRNKHLDDLICDLNQNLFVEINLFENICYFWLHHGECIDQSIKDEVEWRGALLNLSSGGPFVIWSITPQMFAFRKQMFVIQRQVNDPNFQALLSRFDRLWRSDHEHCKFAVPNCLIKVHQRWGDR